MADLAETRKGNNLLLGDVHKHLLAEHDKPTDRRQDIIRFVEKVTVKESGCWEWTETSRDGSGYGMFFLDGHSQRSHRVVAGWLLGRPMEPEEKVLHTCDNPPCCNPYHLFIGSHDDNMKDMAAKGRGRTSPGRAGEGNPYAKLTWDIVRTLRARYVKGSGVLQRELADEYGVSQGKVSAIVNNKVWKEDTVDSEDVG